MWLSLLTMVGLFTILAPSDKRGPVHVDEVVPGLHVELVVQLRLLPVHELLLGLVDSRGGHVLGLHLAGDHVSGLLHAGGHVHGFPPRWQY